MLGLSGFNQSRVLIDIERLIKMIIDRSGLRLPFWSDFQLLLFCQTLSQTIPRLLSFYQRGHEYSEHIGAFWHACEKLGLLDCGEPTAFVNQLALPDFDHVAFWSEFAARTLEAVHAPIFRRCEADRRYQQQIKRKRLDSYTRSVLNKYARTLVLRVDLGYRKDHMVPVLEVYAHVDRLLELIGKRYGIFQDLTGYAIGMEQGEDKGYHLHMAALFPGHLHQRDGFLAQQLGFMWIDITGGIGTYHSCNAQKDQFELRGRRGVGMIHRQDEHGCSNVVQALGYLADIEKENQFLRMKPRGRRTYFTGNLS